MPAPSYSAIDLIPTTALTAVPGGTGLDPFEIPDIVFALSRAYVLQRGRTPRVYNGTTLNTASGIAPASLTISATSTGYTASTLVTIVYYDPDDEEFCTTGPFADLTTDVLFRAITLANEGIQVLIPDPPASQPRLRRARVFRALDGTADLRELTGTGTYSDIPVIPGAGGIHTFSDVGGVLDAELATRDPLNLKKRYQSEGNIPATWTGEFYLGRLFIVNPTKPNELLFSESNLPEDIPTANVVTILPSAEDPSPYVMKILANNGQLWAYTRRGGYLISNDAPPFKVTPFFRGVGTESTKGMVYLDGAGAIFPSSDGFYVHPGGSDVSILGSDKKWPGTNPIEDLYRAMDKGRMESVVGIIDRDFGVMSFACPLAEGDAVNLGGFDYDITRRNWSKFSGRVVTVYGKWANVSGRFWTVFGDELGGVWQAQMGNSEGLFATTFSGTMNGAQTAGNNYSLSQSISTYSNIAGLPVYGTNSLNSDQPGDVGAVNRSLSYDSNNVVLWLLYPKTYDSTPLTVYVGAINSIWQSGWFEVLKNHYRGTLHYIDVYLRKDAGGTIRVKVGMNQNSTLVTVTEAMSVAQDMDRLAVDDRGNRMQVRFEGIAPGTDWAVVGIGLEISPSRYKR